MSLAEHSHAQLMDGVYRYQRHFYDLTRKYYLLGRDRLIEDLAIPDGGTVLELGCGTGRNLIQTAKRYPNARLFGLDISSGMLETASVSLARRGLSKRVQLAHGDASSFDTQALFGQPGFDRIFVSYSLSMIPEWRGTINAALEALNERGSLHVVDFGKQERLPVPFKTGLRAWLAKFHVTPRDSLRDVLEAESRRIGQSLSYSSLYRGYAMHSVLTLP